MMIFENYKTKKHKAFSLAESIISMLLLVLVILLTMSSITRKKTQPDKITTISGMYACWKPVGETVRQEYYDGQRQATDDKQINPASSDFDCSFKMDRRVYKYYIYAVGAKSNGVNPQVVQRDVGSYGGSRSDGGSSSDNNMRLDIKFNSDSGLTEVKQGDTTIASAKGNIKPTDSELVPGNIKDCKYIDSSGSGCGSGASPICKVYSNTDGSITKTALVLQCMDGDCNSQEKNCHINIDEHNPKKNGSVYTGNCSYDNDGDEGITHVTVKVTETDSSLKAKEANSGESEFVKHLKMIPSNMQNGLSDQLLREYNGTDDRDLGPAVLILW